MDKPDWLPNKIEDYNSWDNLEDQEEISMIL